MKTTRLLTGAIVLATGLLVQTAFAQTSVTTTNGGGGAVVSTTTSAGTISEFSPDTIVIRSETSPEPIRYSYSKNTTYVDETGAPVSLELVRSGLPVTVHYIKEGDRMVASRVIVRRKTTITDDGVSGVETRTVERAGTPAVLDEKRSQTTTTTREK